jgi:hypothetical protein
MVHTLEQSAGGGSGSGAKWGWSGEREASGRGDSVLRSLLTEVEDHRRQFDKKWAHMLQYLVRRY